MGVAVSERAQIHVTQDGRVKIYSRNSEDNSPKYPDVAALFPGALKPGITSGGWVEGWRDGWVGGLL